MNNPEPLRIEPSEIEAIYERLNRIGALGDAPDKGFNRPAYSTAETDAMRHIESLAVELGLAARWDGVGNLVVETPGNYDQWIETGSHIDTVPGGGNFDGTAGVVAGLAVLQQVQKSGVALKKGLRLRVWRGEESAAFGVTSIGSHAAFGRLAADALESKHQARTLAEAMQSQGADPELVRKQQPSIPQNERDAIDAHIELHIEQGSVLESEGKDIGIVTGIRGSVRSWVKLHGGFDHSGATPMGHPFRRDVNLAMAYMQVELDRLAKEAIADGQDIVQTVGVINSSPEMNSAMPEVSENAVSKISGAGYFSHEVRSISGEQAASFAAKAFAVVSETGKAHGVEAEIETFSLASGIESMDARLQELTEQCCRNEGLSHTRLPSGAWHDAAVLCGEKRSDGSPIPVGMLFIPCRSGISHSPEEYSTPAQIAAGATVLARMMVSLAG